MYNEKIFDAIQFAIQVHEIDQKQKRKAKDIAYITHPLTVGIMLAHAGASEDVIIAGILHDTIEDSIAEKKVTREMIAEKFGDNVADLVMSVTEEDKSLSWHKRKAAALERIKTYSHDSLLVKSADVLSNGWELVKDVEENDDSVFDRFNASKEDVMDHYLRIEKAIFARWYGLSFCGERCCVRSLWDEMRELGDAIWVLDLDNYIRWDAYKDLEFTVRHKHSDKNWYDPLFR